MYMSYNVLYYNVVYIYENYWIYCLLYVLNYFFFLDINYIIGILIFIFIIVKFIIWKSLLNWIFLIVENFGFVRIVR